jgi:transcriptional regulator with XRE-family HTH domain
MKKKTLQDLRKEKKLTQEQSSKILSITKEYLSMLENGERNPSDNLKEKMSKLYNCDIADIFLAINSTKRLKSIKNKIDINN